MLTLEDTCQTYQLGPQGERMASMLFELVYDAMEKGLAKHGQVDRFRIPLELEGRDDTFFTQHSTSGVMRALMQSPEAMEIIEWLEQDAVVQRYAQSHPNVLEHLARFRELAEDARILEMPIREKVLGGNVTFY
jgi:hypothetical protein